VGGVLLLGVVRAVDITATLRVLQHNLATPRAAVLALLSGVSFLLAFSIRGVRWSLFLKPVARVGVLTTVRLFLISTTFNFLLPIRGGEVIKSVILKRIAAVPISRSLPTVAMDKSLDLMPALLIMVIVPLAGLRMDIRLWLVLGTIAGLLLVLTVFIALSVLRPRASVGMLQRTVGWLPRGLRTRLQGVASGFVESLVSAAGRPQVFLPAVGLTCVAVLCDGAFAMLAFWTVGFPISFGTVLFGYTVYNMFYVIPTPPGQVGSNEAVGLLVFSGLLHLPATQVLAMFVFSHSWAAVLMCTSGPICLKTLGLKMPATRDVDRWSESSPAGEVVSAGP
jgi:uncharacterized protein (TIRG00374 family)